MNRYFMYLFHGQANRLSPVNMLIMRVIYTKFQQLDSRHSHDINNLNRQYSNVANPKITKKLISTMALIMSDDYLLKSYQTS